MNLCINPLHMLRIIWIKRFSTMYLPDKTPIRNITITSSKEPLKTEWENLVLTSPHLIKWAYSMQWAAVLGVSARVHKGYFTCGGKSHMVHSKQGVNPGRITLAWPLKPSVPPSTMGLILASNALSSASYSRLREREREREREEKEIKCTA